MKRMIVFLVLAALALAGCPLNTPGHGYIQVLIQPVGSKSLGAEFASAHSDYYTVLAYNADRVVYLSVANIQTSNVITVPVGTYNVVVLAGNDRYPGSTELALLGSGYTSAVDVVENTTTTVNIGVHSIDFVLAVPADVPAGSLLTVGLVYDTNSPVLANRNAGGVYLSDNAFHQLSGSFSGSNGYSHFEGSATFSAPGATGGNVVSYSPGQLLIRDGSIPEFYVQSVCEDWKLPFYWHDDPAITGLATIPITIVAGAQGIQTIVNWID